MSARKNSINLLIKEGFEYTPTGRVLHWLLTAGRTIVILTELVVIIAFLSRFWLDRMLTDISEQNNAKRLQIESSSAFETEFRSAQERLSLIQSIQAVNNSPSDMVKTISTLLPSDVSITDLSINEEGKITIQGTSFSEPGIAGLITSLNNTKKFKNITLDDINLDTRGTQIIKFVIKAELNKGGQ